MRNNTAAIEAQIKHIEGAMIGLMQRIETLAPHPDQPKSKGCVFASIHSDIKPAADYDGMLGSIGMEAFLGTAFSAASEGVYSSDSFSGMEAMHADRALEAYSAYITDKDASNNQGRGKGTFALGEHKTICNTFNTLDERALAMQAFKADEDERLILEKNLVAHDRMLSTLKSAQNAPEFRLAA